MQINISTNKGFDKIYDEYNSSERGKALLEMSGISQDKLDTIFYKERFMYGDSNNVANVSVDSNANIKNKNIITYEAEKDKAKDRLMAYDAIYTGIEKVHGKERADQIIRSELEGLLYIADLHLWHKPYCYAFACFDLLTEGLPFIDSPHSTPAKHVSSFIEHVVQALVYYSNMQAGAVAFPDIFVCMSMLLEKDLKSGYIREEDKVKTLEQCFQIFTYTVNQPFRGGLQSPFTNVSVYDREFLNSEMFINYMISDGDDGYIKMDPEKVMELQMMYMDWYNRENKIQLFTFPVITACMQSKQNDTNHINDREFLREISRLYCDRAAYNIYVGKEGTLSSCCRLRNDMTNEYFNSLGTGSIKLGSHRVVTTNFPRLAFISDGDKELFYKNLDEALDMSYQVLDLHRKTLEEEIENGMLPLYKLNLMSLKTQYSTIGGIGLYECALYLNNQEDNEDVYEIMSEIIDHVNNRNSDMQKIIGYPINFEQIPGESVAHKLASKDRVVLEDYNIPEYHIYSNQFVPAWKDVTLTERIKVQGMFDQRMTGGSILHINVSEKIEDPSVMERLIEYSVSKGVVYFAINYNIMKCNKGHINVAKQNTCPTCGTSEITNYTRVVGYLVPTNSWSKEKVEYDYNRRKFYESIKC